MYGMSIDRRYTYVCKAVHTFFITHDEELMPTTSSQYFKTYLVTIKTTKIKIIN